MSEISTIHEALVTRMGTTLFSGHKRLSNPYVLSSNSDQFLEKGWGIAMLGGQNTNRHLGNQVSVERSFALVITRRTFARELDAATRGNGEKTLLEDLQLLIDDLEENTYLDPSTGKYVIRYVSDSGIQQVREDQDSFLAVTVTATVEYFRTIP